jgi:cytochrome c biogenesis protein CcmG, thiol:disulfide interchange protein DsbE
MKKSISILCLLFALAAVSAQSIKKGTAALDFNLTLSTGEKVSLSSYKGRAVLLHFWATWCPPCRAELPGMNALSEKLEKEGTNAKLVFLAVCVSDTEESRAQFMKDNKYTFRGGLDKTGVVADKYGVQGIPTSVLISPDGKIENINVGMMSKEALAQFISAYEK